MKMVRRHSRGEVPSEPSSAMSPFATLPLILESAAGEARVPAPVQTPPDRDALLSPRRRLFINAGRGPAASEGPSGFNTNMGWHPNARAAMRGAGVLCSRQPVPAGGNSVCVLEDRQPWSGWVPAGAPRLGEG